MNTMLKRFLGRSIKTGRLEIVDSAGERSVFGDGSGAPVRIRITTAKAERDLILNPELKLGETFMDGELVVEDGNIYDLLDLLFRNVPTTHPSVPAVLIGVTRYLTKRLRQINTPLRSKNNVAHHYDIDGRIYSLFLDPDMQYSCAYFEEGMTSLEEAQLAKKRHLAAKLALQPGQRVLDIGSGWGGLGLYIAEHFDVEVTGVTLSEEQLAVARKRAEERGLSNKVKFRLEDYRKVQGPFDRIVSVGMFEHVGVGHFKRFFQTCRDLLACDGVMVLHSIGRFDQPADTNSWIQKYIFPGGYLPSLSEVIPVIEKLGLKLTDVEILRLHYAKTLRAWRERFMARRDEAVAIMDERFCRMWEFYLAVSEAAFYYQNLMNFQIQIARHQQALPFTRDYITQTEASLRGSEQHGKARTPLRIAGE